MRDVVLMWKPEGQDGDVRGRTVLKGIFKK